jgi:cellobiose phosphorylase
LPFEQEYAPVEMTYAPPFCIANSYNNSDANLNRVQLQYLSGTVSYVLRNVHNFFFGVTYEYDGLTIKPALPKEFGDCSNEFTYLDKKFRLEFKQTGKDKTFTFNGKTIKADKLFIADSEMSDNNLIVIEY